MADTLKPTPESKKTETTPAATPDTTATTTPGTEPTAVVGASTTTPESTASVPTAETESPSSEAPQTQQSADIEFFLLKWLRSFYNLIIWVNFINFINSLLLIKYVVFCHMYSP